MQRPGIPLGPKYVWDFVKSNGVAILCRKWRESKVWIIWGKSGTTTKTVSLALYGVTNLASWHIVCGLYIFYFCLGKSPNSFWVVKLFQMDRTICKTYISARRNIGICMLLALWNVCYVIIHVICKQYNGSWWQLWTFLGFPSKMARSQGVQIPVCKLIGT